jgi:hypothetical protein
MQRVPSSFLLVPLASCAVPLDVFHERARADDRAPSVVANATTAGFVDAAPAAPITQGRGRPSSYFNIMFGTSYWDDLGDLDTAGTFPVPGVFGDFDDWGSAFSLGFDGEVWDRAEDSVTIGIETGWCTFDNHGGGTTPYSDIAASLSYIAPVVRWRHDLSSAVTVSPGVGLGYYSLSIDEYETYYYGWWWGYDTRTLYDDSALGGFVSLAVDFKTSAWGAFRIDNKLHFAEFDNLDNLTPNESNVHGPIYTLAIGFVYGF